MTELPHALRLRFEVERVLGEGGMGTVFLAIEKTQQRRVALKVLSPENAEIAAELRARFEAEARVTAALQHPGIVTVYDLGVARDTPYILYEYLEGCDLEGLLRSRNGRVEEEWVRAVGIGVAEALEVAHQAGVVHRDLKPANLMVVAPYHKPGAPAEPSAVRVLDFGIARVRGALQEVQTRTGVLLGTPAYMAPEQLLGDEIDRRADLYSLGAVLFELATGQPPFSGSLKEITGGHLKGELPDPRVYNPKITGELAGLIKEMLSRRPAHRPSHARDVAAALRALPAIVTTRPPPPTPVAEPGVDSTAPSSDMIPVPPPPAMTDTIVAAAASSFPPVADSIPPRDPDEPPEPAGPQLGTEHAAAAAVATAMGAGLVGFLLIGYLIVKSLPKGPPYLEPRFALAGSPPKLVATWKSDWEYAGIGGVGDGPPVVEAAATGEHRVELPLPAEGEGPWKIRVGPPDNPFEGEIPRVVLEPELRFEGGVPLLHLTPLAAGVLDLESSMGARQVPLPRNGILRIEDTWAADRMRVKGAAGKVTVARMGGRKKDERETHEVPLTAAVRADIQELLLGRLEPPLVAMELGEFADAFVRYCEVELGLVDPHYQGAKMVWDDEAIGELAEVLVAARSHLAATFHAVEMDRARRKDLLRLLAQLRMVVSLAVLHEQRFRAAGEPHAARIEKLLTLDQALGAMERQALKPDVKRLNSMPSRPKDQILLVPDVNRSLLGLANSRWENDNWKLGAFADARSDPHATSSEYFRLATCRANEVLVAYRLRSLAGSGNIDGPTQRSAVRSILKARALGRDWAGVGDATLTANLRKALSQVEDQLLDVLNRDRRAPQVEIDFELAGEEPGSGYRIAAVLSGLRPGLVLLVELDDGWLLPLMSDDNDDATHLGTLLNEAQRRAAANRDELLPKTPRNGLREMSCRIPKGILGPGKHRLTLRLLQSETPYDLGRRMTEFFSEDDARFELELPRLHQVALVPER